MARYLYAATPADYVVDTSTGLPVPSAVVTVWTARTGGSQVTDLQDLSLGTITQVTADSYGFIAFYGPDGTTDNLWISSGTGPRLLVRVVNDAALESAVLPLSGGTLTGNLTLAGAPSSNLHAATKKYVDDNVANFVAKTGDTMSGSLRAHQASLKVSGDASSYVFERRQGDGTGYGFRLGATSTNPFTATLYDSGGSTLSAALNYSTSTTRWNSTGDTYITGGLTVTGAMGAALAMGSNKITGLAAATANGDAVRYEQVYVRGVNLLVGYTTVTTDGAGYFTIALSGVATTGWIAFLQPGTTGGSVGSIGYGANLISGTLYSKTGVAEASISTTVYYMLVKYNG